MLSGYGVEFSPRTFKMLKREMSKAFVVPQRQMPRIVFHGLILAFIIGGFWLFDSLKDPILTNIVGIEYQPTAKFISVATTLCIVCLYDYLSSLVSKPNLFHIIAIVFGVIFICLSALIGDPSTGFDNKDRGPHRWTGWCAYFFTEAYGSLMVALFWSFTNSIMNLEEAKGAYGLILSIAQLGAISGSTLAANAPSIGISQLYLIGAMHIFCVSLLIKIYNIVYREDTSIRSRVRSISEHEDDDDHDTNADSDAAAERKEARAELQARIRQQTIDSPAAASNQDLSSTEVVVASVTYASVTAVQVVRWCIRGFSGFYEGLTLIFQHTYTLKLLGVSVLFEIVVTVLDYEFKLMGAHSVEHYTEHLLLDAVKEGMDTHYSAEEKFAHLLGMFGQLTNSLSLLVALFGFSYLLRRLTVQVALLIFPVILFLSVILSNLVPTLSVMFAILTVLKALIFSLNEPVKELLYQPTSDAIKFKAKAWIDVFGCRLAKAVGSLITGYAAGDVVKLRLISEIPCIILSLLIVCLSWSIGKDFHQLIESNTVIGAHGIEPAVPHGLDYHGHGYNKHIIADSELAVRNGLRPGDVGYDGYDLKLFEGVFEGEGEGEGTASQRAEPEI
jgi:ATP/ADP translocase